MYMHTIIYVDNYWIERQLLLYSWGHGKYINMMITYYRGVAKLS